MFSTAQCVDSVLEVGEFLPGRVAAGAVLAHDPEGVTGDVGVAGP
jgi:hypothetical protein